MLSTQGFYATALATFNARRALDRRLTIGATDTLARLFTIDAGPLPLLRGAALTALEFVPPFDTALREVLREAPSLPSPSAAPHKS